MPDPFRLLPTRHLGHGFPVAEALGGSVSPVVLELFTSVATGYVLLHAIHRGLSAGGGPYLFTTFFDTLIFDGLASAIVPSFITFHVRTITTIWFRQQFFRSPESLASSPNPSPPPLFNSSSPPPSESPTRSGGQQEEEKSSTRSKRSSRGSVFDRFQQAIHSLITITAADSEESIHAQGGLAVPLSAHTSGGGSFLSTPSARVETSDNGSKLATASRALRRRLGLDEEPEPRQEHNGPSSSTQRMRRNPKPDAPVAQNTPGTSSPEPYPLIASAFSRFSQECASPSGEPRCPAILIARNSMSDPELSPRLEGDAESNVSANHNPLLDSCFSCLSPRCAMPVSAVLITFGAVSPRASFDSDMDLQREPSSDAESPEYQYDQGQEPGDSSPTPQYRADYRSQRSGSNSTSQGQRDTDHQDQPQLEPTAAGEEVPFRQFLTRLCPVYREVDSPPPSCCLRSRPSSPSVPLNEDEACSTATTAFSPSSHPFPLASTTKAICEDAKLPLVVRTWGPVVAGMIALSYTWEHIDRMVDELMNQTIRTVY